MRRYLFLLCVGCLSLAGCQGKQAQAAEPEGATQSSPGRKAAKPTPEVIAKAEALLKANPDAKMGSEMRFKVGGKRYIARVEEHDNAGNDPERPPGKHKGITVYEAD
jgi:hypothetical protein